MEQRTVQHSSHHSTLIGEKDRQWLSLIRRKSRRAIIFRDPKDELPQAA